LTGDFLRPRCWNSPEKLSSCATCSRSCHGCQGKRHPAVVDDPDVVAVAVLAVVVDNFAQELDALRSALSVIPGCVGWKLLEEAEDVDDSVKGRTITIQTYWQKINYEWP